MKLTTRTNIIIFSVLLFVLLLVLQSNKVWNIFTPYKEIVEEYSTKYDIDPLFVTAVMKEESTFITWADNAKTIT